MTAAKFLLLHSYEAMTMVKGNLNTKVYIRNLWVDLNYLNIGTLLENRNNVHRTKLKLKTYNSKTC